MKNNLAIAQLDPRTVILWSLVYAFFLAAQKSFLPLLASLFIVLFYIVLTPFSCKEILKKLKPVNFFLLFFWLIIPFSLQGKALFSLGKYAYTLAGVKFCLLITLKANLLMLIFICLLLSLSPSQLASGLQSLKISEKLVYLFLLAYRYLFLLKEEKDKLLRSLKIRGFKPKTNLFTYKTYAYLLGLILLKAYERGDRVHKALVLRGFQGKFPSLYSPKFTQKDLYFSLFSGLNFLLLLYLQLT
ncbi:MAG TPA: cobalt ECF transporter T component CbiQ [Desulfonauticus sp.]|jgi:cobalt/nickel transport system permease protein|nr:MAG: Cobalt ABC transporter, inner membrane subunit CbiQ [Desulfonauticus sp. 38_4375]MDK2922057.1 cobalt/nickel transport system permease protein [Desulfonauticus sp.]HCO12514.1 cobalt ECF transporter T component CbiQ [Desulfonauticus sp.]